MIKGWILEDVKTIIYAHNIGPPLYIRQMATRIKMEINNNTMGEVL